MAGRSPDIKSSANHPTLCVHCGNADWNGIHCRIFLIVVGLILDIMYLYCMYVRIKITNIIKEITILVMVHADGIAVGYQYIQYSY